MDSRLIPVNTILALVNGHGGWPTPLRDAGFRVHLLEAPIQTSKGPTAADVMLVRTSPALALLCEAKGGANVDEEQASKYAAADWESLRRAGTEPRGLGDAADVRALYACTEEHRSRIETGLEKSGLVLPVLSVSPEMIKLTDGQLIGVPSFELPCSGPPPAIFVVDALSPDEEIIDAVAPVVVAAMSRRLTYISVRFICEQVIREWAAMSRGAQHAFERKVTTAVRALAASRMKKDIALDSGGAHDARVLILRSPEEHDRRGRTQSYQRIERSAARATGKAIRFQPDNQLSFDDLASEGGLDED